MVIVGYSFNVVNDYAPAADCSCSDWDGDEGREPDLLAVLALAVAGPHRRRVQGQQQERGAAAGGPGHARPPARIR